MNKDGFNANAEKEIYDLPMLWYYWLRYFSLWMGALANIGTGMNLFRSYNSDFQFAGLLYIAAGVFAIYVRHTLAKYRVNAPLMVETYLIICAVGNVIPIVLNSDYYSNEDSIVQIIVVILVYVPFIMANKRYFRRRQHYFNGINHNNDVLVEEPLNNENAVRRYRINKSNRSRVDDKFGGKIVTEHYEVNTDEMVCIGDEADMIIEKNMRTSKIVPYIKRIVVVALCLISLFLQLAAALPTKLVAVIISNDNVPHNEIIGASYDSIFSAHLSVGRLENDTYMFWTVDTLRLVVNFGVTLVIFGLVYLCVYLYDCAKHSR